MEIKRDSYLEQLKIRKDNGMIKIITGIRRCGKSFLLFVLFKKYLLESGVDNDHIIEIALDGIENEELREPKKCYLHIKERVEDDHKYYLLLDEVQFAENAWYFRNALVRANYTNLQKGIHETTEYLEAVLRNLLLNEKNELHNRNLHVSGLLNEEKVDIGDTKVDIENKKVDIQDEKVDIESVLPEKGSDFSVKTMVHIHRLFEKFGFDEVFGRSAVMELLELKGSGASKLLPNLVQADIIEPVSGHGKGKYKFKK